MRLRFLQVTPVEGGAPYQVGQELDVPEAPPELGDWLARAQVELVPDEGLETAVEPDPPEHAVQPPAKKKRKPKATPKRKRR